MIILRTLAQLDAHDRELLRLRDGLPAIRDRQAAERTRAGLRAMAKAVYVGPR